MLRWSLWLISFALIPSCQGQSSQNTVQSAGDVASDTGLSGEGIPVYETFDEIAPIFNKQTDTTYLINFWATWCKPCVAEMPYIERLHDDFSGEKLSVILVSLDFPDQIESKVIPFVEQNRLRSNVIVLTDGKYNDWIDRVEPAWGGAIPFTVIYNAKKRIFIEKPIANYEELKATVESFL